METFKIKTEHAANTRVEMENDIGLQFCNYCAIENSCEVRECNVDEELKKFLDKLINY